MVNKKALILSIIFMILPSVLASEHYFNTSDFGNQTAYTGILTKANEYTEGWFGTGFLFGLFLIIYIVGRRYTTETKRAITAALFITILVGILIIPLNIVKLEFILLLIIGLAAAVITLYI